MTTWVYQQSEPGLYTVGFYDPNGKWHTDSDGTKQECGDRVAVLNGGQPEQSKLFVFCSGGQVQDVVDRNGDPARNVQVIDYDNCDRQENNHQCPVCMHCDVEENADGERICPECGYDLDSDKGIDAIRHALAIEIAEQMGAPRE